MLVKAVCYFTNLAPPYLTSGLVATFTLSNNSRIVTSTERKKE